MGRAGSFVSGCIVGGAAIFTSLKYHVVQTNKGFEFVPKLTASFSGAMRSNLIAMLDGIGVAQHLGLKSAAELFTPGGERVHLTSALRYPVFKDGENYYADQSPNFFVGNAFPTCGINFTAQEIMGQSEANQ